MSIDHKITSTFIAAFVTSLMYSVSAQAFEQPDCSAMQSWSSAHQSKDIILLAPKVGISGMFADGRTISVFGSSVSSWVRNDFNQVGRWLKDCRRIAVKQKNKGVSEQLYQAYKLVSATAAPVSKMLQFREQSKRAINNLVNYHRSDTLTKVLELAGQALQGNDVTNEIRALPVTSNLQNEVLTLQNASGYLSTADIEILSVRLKLGASELKQEMAAQKEEFEALKQELANVPMTYEGSRILDRLNQHPLLSKFSRQEALDFQNEVMHKRMTINQALQQQSQQKSIEAAIPIQVVAYIEKLISGYSVKEVALRGIKPGIPYLYAEKFMSTRFNFKSSAAADLFKEFGPTHEDVKGYKQAERRDGGHFEFETMGEIVGQIKFTEHFTGLMDLNEPRNWLKERFGDPDQFKYLGNAIIMAWHDDGINLEINPGNRTTLPYRSPQEYKSSLVITIWSDDYKQYLIDAEKRCKDLRSMPMSELSVQDKIDIMNGCKH